jgi:hypothetical protein
MFNYDTFKLLHRHGDDWVEVHHVSSTTSPRTILSAPGFAALASTAAAAATRK